MEIVVRRRSGRIVDVDLGAVGSRSSDADLGAVDPRVAADWLMSLADRDADTEASERALAGATVARGAEPAPRLLDLARDRGVHREVRSAALFWVSQIAADGIDASLAGIAADEGDDQEVRDAAVFALSRRPDDVAVPALMDLARTAPHTRTRRTALFWLAQSEDERVPDFFAELIRGSGG
jgi:HEAT repeat protein